jgi:spore coat protein CotH
LLFALILSCSQPTEPAATAPGAPRPDTLEEPVVLGDSPPDRSSDLPEKPPEEGLGLPPPIEDNDEGVVSLPEPGDGYYSEPSDYVYDDQVVHVVELTMTEEAIQSLNRSGRTNYEEAQFAFNGEDFGAVGIRLKGGSTYQTFNGKPGLKIKFDWEEADGTDEEERFYEVRRMNMHAMYYDVSALAENLAYVFFRAAGVPAPRTGYARLFVNGEDYGLYDLVEPIEDEFLAIWFSSNDGNLYEGVSCDLNRCTCLDAEEYDEGNDDALLEWCDALGTYGDDWDTLVEEYMVMDRFTGFLAMEMALGHWDSYSYNLNNYRFYHDPEEDNWTIIPWSTDLAFGHSVSTRSGCSYGTEMSRYTSGLLSRYCKEDDFCNEIFLDRMEEVANQLEAFDAEAWIDETQGRLEPEIETDPKIAYDVAEFYTMGACIKDFIAARPEEIRDYVAGAR